MLLDHGADVWVVTHLPGVVTGAEPIGVAGLRHQPLGLRDVRLPTGGVLGPETGPGGALFEAITHVHHGAWNRSGIVLQQVVYLLPVQGQVDGLAHPDVVEWLFLQVDHQENVEGAGEFVSGDVPIGTALGVRVQLEVLDGAQVGESAVHHLQLAALELSGQRAGIDDDEVVDAFEEGPSLFEVVGVLDHGVAVAPLVLGQHEWSGPRTVGDDIFRQVQVYILLQQVLGKDFRVVQGQELHEGAGGKGQVELHGVVVQGTDAVFLNRLGIVAE